MPVQQVHCNWTVFVAQIKPRPAFDRSLRGRGEHRATRNGSVESFLCKNVGAGESRRIEMFAGTLRDKEQSKLLHLSLGTIKRASRTRTLSPL